MRSSEDLCLLCASRKANKKNSHIVPRFMTKSILGNQTAKRAYRLNTMKPNGPHTFTQDSDKEDYLLCELCESYFAILETYIATRLHNRLWHVRYENQFTTHANQAGVTWKICNGVDPIILRLFLVSIIWRCSVSESFTFNNFSLPSEEQEICRQILNNYYSASQQALFETVFEKEVFLENFQFLIFTAESMNSTGNFVFTHPTASNPYYFALNEYMLFFSFQPGTTIHQLQEIVNNGDNSRVKVGFFKRAFWESILNDTIQFFVNVSAH